MKYSKLSNKSVTGTMKHLLLMAFTMWVVSCGEKAPESTSTIHGDKIINLNGVLYVKGSSTPFTGRFFDSFENGVKRLEANVKDGKFHGLLRRWYENGQKETEIIFVEGTMHGASSGWFKNGQMKSEVIFKEGKLNGGVLNWHENGQKRREATYKDGVLISENFWNKKGEEVDSKEEAEQ